MNIYGLCHAIGFIIDYKISKYLANKHINLTEIDFMCIFLCMMFSSVIGARIMSFLETATKLENIHKIYQGGLTSFGTIYAILIMSYILSHTYNINFILFTEWVILSSVFHIALGRLGNYLKGELPGKYSSFLKRRHPSQLYQLVTEGIILSLIEWYFYDTLGQGIIFITAPIIYGFFRFFCGFFKEEDQIMPKWFRRSLYRYITWYQFQSICFPLICGIIFIFNYK